jgi:hypothetical protein
MPATRELHWDRVWEHVRRQPLPPILMIVYSSFCSGFGSATLLGPKAFRCTPRGLIVYATLCSVLCTLLFGLILVKALCIRQNDTVQPPRGA